MAIDPYRDSKISCMATGRQSFHTAWTHRGNLLTTGSGPKSRAIFLFCFRLPLAVDQSFRVLEWLGLSLADSSRIISDNLLGARITAASPG